jgi:hypothetical protein
MFHEQHSIKLPMFSLNTIALFFWSCDYMERSHSFEMAWPRRLPLWGSRRDFAPGFGGFPMLRERRGFEKRILLASQEDGFTELSGTGGESDS